MELRVEVSGHREDFERESFIVKGFDDAEKIGTKVGRAVRDWLRRVPVRKQGQRIRVEVNAGWTERASRAGKGESE